MVEKRKRDEHTELRVASYTAEPQLAVSSFFKGFTVPKDAEFDLYKNKQGDVIFHGENDRLEYDSVNLDQDPSDYAIAVYDPLSRSVELYKAPVLLGNVTSKAHKKLRGPAVKQKGVRMNIQRNALGEEFGTKKAKKAITDQERNRIDADRLADSQADIIDTVKEHTMSLPTRAELEQAVVDDRPTPVANVNATAVEDIYSINSIIPKKEQQFIRVGPIINEKDPKKRLELMPFQESKLIKSQLESINSQTSEEKVQLIYYASLLMGVYHNRRLSNKLALTTQLNSPPEVLIDGIIDRFAISRAGQFGRSKERGFRIDPYHEDKILCFLLATIMHICGFHLEIVPLADDLSLKPAKLPNLCKALGATVKSASVTEAEAFGINKNMASSYKIASLKVPFKLPQMTKRVRRN